jgi:hypothetical protein
MTMATLHLSEAALWREQLTGLSSSDRVFFYIDGIPTKDRWVALDDVNSWTDYSLPCRLKGSPKRAYGGDVLAADVEGDLARCFYSSRFDLFDLNRYVDARDKIDEGNLDRNAVAAFIDSRGNYDLEGFRDSYQDHYDSEEAFAEQLIEDCGLLADAPVQLVHYFDMASFARDLFMCDYNMDDGSYVFASY